MKGGAKANRLFLGLETGSRGALMVQKEKKPNDTVSLFVWVDQQARSTELPNSNIPGHRLCHHIHLYLSISTYTFLLPPSLPSPTHSEATPHPSHPATQAATARCLRGHAAGIRARIGAAILHVHRHGPIQYDGSPRQKRHAEFVSTGPRGCGRRAPKPDTGWGRVVEELLVEEPRKNTQTKHNWRGCSIGLLLMQTDEFCSNCWWKSSWLKEKSMWTGADDESISPTDWTIYSHGMRLEPFAQHGRVLYTEKGQARGAGARVRLL